MAVKGLPVITVLHDEPCLCMGLQKPVGQGGTGPIDQADGHLSTL